MHANWNEAKLEDLALVRADRITPTKEDLTPYVGLEHLASVRNRLLGYEVAGQALSQKAVFCEGDILFGKLRPELRKVVRAPFDGVCSTDILAIFARDPIDAAYLYHLLSSESIYRVAVSASEGTKMPRVSWVTLRRFRFSCPSREERQGIAEHLDAIDEAIERTVAVIEATGRLRQGLVQELLTRGLPRRHSEWKQVPGVGTVPACWRVASLGDIADVVSGIALGPARRNGLNRMPYLTVANVKFGFIEVIETRYMALSVQEQTTRTVRPGDLLLVEGHAQPSQLGRAAMVPVELAGYAFQNHLFRVRANRDQAENAFLMAFINSTFGRRYFEQFSGTTSGLQTVSTSNVRGLRLALPPLAEQAAICEALESVSQTSSDERAYLQHLIQIKKAISEALLTGKLRVCQPDLE